LIPTEWDIANIRQVRFAACPAAVLDCANGYQKEGKKEVSEIQKKRRQEVGREAHRSQTRNSQEISEEESRAQENRTQESAGENSQRED
jgi:protein required for attachment to host cells